MASQQPRTPHRRGRHRLHPQDDQVTRRRIGEANPNGRLERPLGRFYLAEHLDAPGAIPLTEALALVEADWDRQVAAGTVSASVIAKYRTDVRTLIRTATNRGLTNLAEITPSLIYTWMRAAKVNDPNAEVTQNTRLARRSAARAFFLTAQALGLHDQNPALSVEEPRRTPRYVRPFTDAEIDQIKRIAPWRMAETQAPAAIALILSGATNGEVAYTTVVDVDLTNRRVWIHDGGKRARDRWIPLDDDWCYRAIARRVEVLGADPTGAVPARLLTYAPRGGEDTLAKRSAATSLLVLKVLRKARVWRAGDTRAESIREWLALKVYAETGRIEAVAARLGMASLDAAAHIVGIDWITEHGIDAPPPPHAQGGP